MKQPHQATSSASAAAAVAKPPVAVFQCWFDFCRCGSTTWHGTAWCPSSASPTTPFWGGIYQQERTPVRMASQCPTTPSTSPRSSSPTLPCESPPPAPPVEHRERIKSFVLRKSGRKCSKCQVNLEFNEATVLATERDICWRSELSLRLTVSAEERATGESRRSCK